MRRRLAWSLSLPLILGGTQAAHTFAYRLAYPEAEVRWRMLSASGHGYGAYLPLLAGLLGAVLLTALAASAVDAVRGRAVGPLPAWAFAVLPPLVYSLQEFTERWVAGADFPWWMVMQPTFRYGLLLQLPFAVAAFLVARLLLRTAVAVARALAPRRRGVVWLGPAEVVPRFDSVVLVRSRLGALGWTLRGPPVATR